MPPKHKGKSSGRWQSRFKASRFEPKDLDFVEQTSIYFPGRHWSELKVAEQVEVIRRSLAPINFWLIDPHSFFMKYWDMLIVFFLLFTGVVTPYEVVFVGPLQSNSSLFILNRVIDGIFTMDIVSQFFLKVEIVSKSKRGKILLKQPWLIRKRYICSWFFIDLISVAQFDVLFLVYEASGSVAGIKILRMVRLLRLMKLLRMVRTSRLMSRWQNYFTISFGVQKLMKFSFALLLCSHWMACFWGLVGFSLGKELCDRDRNLIFSPDDVSAEDVSWITVLYSSGGKTTPDSPCNPWHVYTASLHWSVMTITSIGYGDIVPQRSEEYLACIVCMLLGGVMWANIIGSTCAIIARGDRVEDNFEANTDLLNMVMKDTHFPKRQQNVYREYLRESKVVESFGQFRDLAQNFSPLLKGQLLLHMSHTWTQKIHYLKSASERCLMSLVDALQMHFFSRKEMLNIASDYLCINERGTIARGGKIITPGGIFQTDFIVTNPSLRRLEECISLTYSLVMTLQRDSFLEITDSQADVARDIRRAALRLAILKCLHLCKEAKRESEQECGKSEPMSLADAFDALQVSDCMYMSASKSASRSKICQVTLAQTEGEEVDVNVNNYPALIEDRDHHDHHDHDDHKAHPSSSHPSSSDVATERPAVRQSISWPVAVVRPGGEPSASASSSLRRTSAGNVRKRIGVLEQTLVAALEELSALRDEVDGDLSQEVEIDSPRRMSVRGGGMATSACCAEQSP